LDTYGHMYVSTFMQACVVIVQIWAVGCSTSYTIWWWSYGSYRWNVVKLCWPPPHRCEIGFSCIYICSQMHVMFQNCVTPIYSLWCRGRSTDCNHIVALVVHKMETQTLHHNRSCMSSKLFCYSLFIVYYLPRFFFYTCHFNEYKVYSSALSMSMVTSLKAL